MSDTQNASACDRPDVRPLLARYEFGAVDRDERGLVDAHVLECDVCFAELERGADVVTALRDDPQRFRRALDGLSPPVRSHRTLFVRIALPLAACVAIALGVVVATRWTDETRLATFPQEIDRARVVRAPGALAAVDELVATGASYFDLGRYAEAERYFEAACRRDSTRADAAYALGLALALGGDPARGAASLGRAVRLAPEGEGDAARWALANAYLAAGRGQEARRELATLSAGTSSEARRAEALLRRLER